MFANAFKFAHMVFTTLYNEVDLGINWKSESKSGSNMIYVSCCGGDVIAKDIYQKRGINFFSMTPIAYE